MAHDAAPRPSVPPRRGAAFEHALVVISLAAVAAVALIGAWAAWYPHQTSYVEGYLLEQGARLADGEALYRPLGDPPWIVDNFPPVYPLAVAIGVKVFGTSFAFGRLLTLIAAGGLFLLATRWHRRLGAPPAIALALATLWLTSPYVVRRALLLRMDLAAILLVSLAIWTYLRLHDKRPQLAAPAAALLFALALGVRQTMLAAPLALGIVLLWHGRRRDAAVLAGSLVLIGVMATVILQLMTSGGFLLHTLEYNTGRYLFDHYLIRLGRTFAFQWAVLGLGMLGAWFAARRAGFEARLLVTWGVLALASSLTAGKAGSTYNHFLELIWVAGLLAGFAVPAIGRLLVRDSVATSPPAASTSAVAPPASTTKPYTAHTRWAPANTQSATRPAVALALLALLLVHLPAAAVSPAVHTGTSALLDGDTERQLEARLAATPGPVISENAGALVRTGHEVLLEPRTLKELALAGTWDDTALVAAIRNQTYTLLVLQTFDKQGGFCDFLCRFTEPTRQAILDRYTHDETIGQWEIWIPQGDA